VIESSQKELLQKFKPIFYPESIAIVGASQDTRKAGYGWTRALVDAGFSGNIYPVNPNGNELLGLKGYPSLTAIPGTVDYVIVTIPRNAVPDLLDDCAAKKVKAVHLFTAGFSEIGDDAGHGLEKELARKAQQGGFRIIGPNCIGAYCPGHKIPYGPGKITSESGTVSFVSQSGGVGGKLVELGAARGIKYNKGISFGNGIDLDGVDFLEYMAADPNTSVIGAYLEGSHDGRYLFNIMKEVTKIKPLIVWKGGRTDVGAAAAKSHTGSLASSTTMWSAALKQAGVIEVYSLEELADSLLIFQQLQRWQGEGIAVIGGLADGGGGISVASGDICAELGLIIPPLSLPTRQQLGNLLGQVGSILGNPVDVSQGGGKLSTLKESFKVILADPAIEFLVVQEDMGILLDFMSWENVEAINNILIDIRTRQNKPIVVVLAPGLSETERLRAEYILSQASIPVFPTMRRAAKAIANLSRYSRFQAAIKS